jgi:hypothetical protein
MPPMSIRRGPAAEGKGKGKGKGKGIIQPAAKAKAMAKAKAKGTGKGIRRRPAAAAEGKGTGKGRGIIQAAAREDPVLLDIDDGVTIQTLLFDGLDTMQTIKVRLLHLMGWPLPSSDLTLFCGRLEMEDHRTLASYGITGGRRQPFLFTVDPEFPEFPH